jgi:hypothetical protein
LAPLLPVPGMANDMRLCMYRPVVVAAAQCNRCVYQLRPIDSIVAEGTPHTAGLQAFRHAGSPQQTADSTDTPTLTATHRPGTYVHSQRPIEFGHLSSDEPLGRPGIRPDFPARMLTRVAEPPGAFAPRRLDACSSSKRDDVVDDDDADEVVATVCALVRTCSAVDVAPLIGAGIGATAAGRGAALPRLVVGEGGGASCSGIRRPRSTIGDATVSARPLERLAVRSVDAIDAALLVGCGLSSLLPARSRRAARSCAELVISGVGAGAALATLLARLATGTCADDVASVCARARPAAAAGGLAGCEDHAAADHAGWLRSSSAMAFRGSRGRLTATARIDFSSASRTTPLVKPNMSTCPPALGAPPWTLCMPLMLCDSSSVAMKPSGSARQ